MKDKLIETWERIGFIASAITLIIIGILEILDNCFILNYPTITSIITGLASGIIATIIVLYFERKHERNKLRDYYLKYEGFYKRVDIGQDNTTDLDLKGMRDENIGLFIQLNYIGGHEFSLNIEYWKSENAKAKGFIEFNPKDKTSATGYYRYTQGKSYTGEFNHLDRIELSWDESKKEMIVIYRHLHPRKIPFNPDNNRGWEIWAKTNEKQL